MIIQTQLAVIGGGSAGCAAALVAARLGIKTVLIEQETQLGGVSTIAGVNCWEPVVGATGIARELFEVMSTVPNATAIYRCSRHFSLPEWNSPAFPGAEQVIDPSSHYNDTLDSYSRFSDYEVQLKLRRGIIFEPNIWHRCMLQLLQNAACGIMMGVPVVSVTGNCDHIHSVQLSNNINIKADYWIDCAGFLAREAGCPVHIGQETQDVYHEPDAPEHVSYLQNGMTRIFRVTPASQEKVESLSTEIPIDCWWQTEFPPMVATHYPNGDLNCNMLPTMTGLEYSLLTKEDGLLETEKRVRSYWHYLQETYPEFRYYRLTHIFSRPGLRESFRIGCHYMLNENDLLQGISRQTHDDIIAWSDHPIDLHGVCNIKRLTGTYGIPYRSLLPMGPDNLLVAGKIAGFSSLAASGCRLSRTMMQLGQAAGCAAFLAVQHQTTFSSIVYGELVKILESQGIQLKCKGVSVA